MQQIFIHLGSIFAITKKMVEQGNICRALLRKCRTFLHTLVRLYLQIYRALLRMYRALLRIRLCIYICNNKKDGRRRKCGLFCGCVGFFCGYTCASIFANIQGSFVDM